MLRSLALASLLAAPAYLASAGHDPAPPQLHCANTLVHEPLLIFERTGSTLAGAYDLHLLVYNDGSARLSSATGGTKGQGRTRLANVGVEEAYALMTQLSAAGVNANCDAQGSVTDMPLATVTVLRGMTDARARTYSYWIDSDPYDLVEGPIQAFIAAHFADF